MSVVTAPERRRPHRRVVRPRRSLWLAIPVLLVLVVGVGLPLLSVAYGAVQSANPAMPDSQFTLDALRRVYLDAGYLRVLAGTLAMSAVVGALSVAVGAGLAWVVTRTDVRMRRTLELLVISPLFLSPFIGAVAWVTLSAPNSGMLNVLWRQLTGAEAPMFDVLTTGGMIWVMTLYYVPFGFMFTASSLRNMDPSLEEASYLNGVGPLRTAMRVTLRVATPALASAFFFVAILAAGLFSVPGALGGSGGFRPLAVRVYNAISVFPSDHALAAAIGSVLVWVTLLGIHQYRRLTRLSKRYVTVSARGFRPRIVALGRLRAPAAAVCWFYVLVAVILPYAALIVVSLTPYTITDFRRMTFTLDNVVSTLTSGRVVEATLNTFTVGLVAPTLCVLLALLIAYLVERRGGLVNKAIDYLATLPIAVPGIVFATGMIWVYIRTPLYATVWLLVVAYVFTYIAHSARLVSTGLLQIDPALEEAATVNGASLPRTLWTVTGPLTKPALLSAWVLTFIFTVREINAAILLYSPRSMVLSVLTWDFLEFGRLQAAAVVGLLQTVLLLGGVLVGRFVFRVRLTDSV